MQFERIKKNYRKEIIIGGLILVCVISAITITTTRAKYKITESIDLAKGTVNYKPYDFKIMAMYKSDDGTNYTEITNRMPTSGYIINESKSYCSLDNKIHDTEAKMYTENKKHIFENLKKADKCYIYFDKINNINIDNIISTSGYKTSTPSFDSVSTTNEGVYRTSDGMYGGYSYYWRGAAMNNYVKFGGFCWRIIRINGDKSVRLLYDGATCHANGTSTIDSIAVPNQKYSMYVNKSEYVGWSYNSGMQRTIEGTASNAKIQTDTWYKNTIGNNVTYNSKVADGKFCNDRSTASGYNWSSEPSSLFYYAAYDRAGINGKSANPSLNCINSGDIYVLKAGAITMDEEIMAGADWNRNNTAYFLYNGNSYYSMTPYYAASNSIPILTVNSSGQLRSNDTSNIGIRPVINLRSDVTFKAGGDGTLNNPYVAE